MLTKRTNILFDSEMWTTLVALAKDKKTSVGELVREAVEKKYMKKKKLLRAQKAYNTILKIRKKQKDKVDYKALIEYGRKY